MGRGVGGPEPFAPEPPLLSPVPLPPGRRPCRTLATPASLAPKPRPHARPAGALGRGPHPRTDRRKTMRTSSGARASASGSRTRRFSFRRACGWNLVRYGTRGGQGRGPGARGRRKEGSRSPPRTHNRPVRDVVLAQHGGQLSVREDCVVVHGEWRGPGGGPRPGDAGRATVASERGGDSASASGAAALASRSRHTSVATPDSADCERGAGRGRALSSSRCGASRPWEREGRA